MLGDSYSGLKMALSRFENSKEALDTVSATPEGARLGNAFFSACFLGSLLLLLFLHTSHPLFRSHSSAADRFARFQALR